MFPNAETGMTLAKIRKGKNMVKVTCCGAAGSVTGSNFLVETSIGKSLIVDCGLFQGGKEMERRNWEGWGYDPKNVKNLILTHAHIDHSGRIPKLVKDGFRGKIITSPPTAELCKIMLLDSAHVQEMDAEWQTKKNRRQGKRAIEPLYRTRDAEESLRYLAPVELDQTIDLEPGSKVRLRNAGHVLGSAIAELWVEDEGKEIKIVFTGDMGKHDQLIVADPFEIVEADYLFIESTYGDRFHRTVRGEQGGTPGSYQIRYFQQGKGDRPRVRSREDPGNSLSSRRILSRRTASQHPNLSGQPPCH